MYLYVQEYTHSSHSYRQVCKKIVSMHQSHHSLSTNSKGMPNWRVQIVHGVIHPCEFP